MISVYIACIKVYTGILLCFIESEFHISTMTYMHVIKKKKLACMSEFHIIYMKYKHIIKNKNTPYTFKYLIVIIQMYVFCKQVMYKIVFQSYNCLMIL